MSFLEENSGKIATTICLASAFPLMATVYTMKLDAMSGDNNPTQFVAQRETKEAETVSYFEQEEGNTEDNVAAVNTDIQDSVISNLNTIKKENSSVQKVEYEEHYIPEYIVLEPSDEEELLENPEEGVTENVQIEETETEIQLPEQQPIIENSQNEGELNNVEQPAPGNVSGEWGVEIPDESVIVDKEENNLENMEENTDVPVDSSVDVEEPVAPEVPVETEGTENPYADLNNRIASSALSLVGVTDGQWCTQVVQQALALAGVQDAYQLWPDQYAGVYGYYTDDPQPGNLIYYYNGGRGVDHIAIYIGDGMAVHGNYGYGDGMGDTVVASVYINGGAPQYIQVCR